MDKMKIGDNFWVSEYYTGSDVGGVTQWQVLEIIKVPRLGTMYRAKRLDQKENPHIDLFSTTGSPDVLRARVYRTQEELEEYQKVTGRISTNEKRN